MTLAKTGSRPLVVRGLKLRFSVLTADARTGSSVVADALGPDRPITPARIADIASTALDAGWQPGEGKGVFCRWVLLPDGELRRCGVTA